MHTGWSGVFDRLWANGLWGDGLLGPLLGGDRWHPVGQESLLLVFSSKYIIAALSFFPFLLLLSFVVLLLLWLQVHILVGRRRIRIHSHRAGLGLCHKPVSGVIDGTHVAAHEVTVPYAGSAPGDAVGGENLMFAADGPEVLDKVVELAVEDAIKDFLICTVVELGLDLEMAVPMCTVSELVCHSLVLLCLLLFSRFPRRKEEADCTPDMVAVCDGDLQVGWVSFVLGEHVKDGSRGRSGRSGSRGARWRYGGSRSAGRGRQRAR